MLGNWRRLCMGRRSDSRFFYDELKKLTKELDDEKRKNIKLEQFIDIINTDDKQTGGKGN
jgi:hypothetical protein